jgi:plastocyanin
LTQYTDVAPVRPGSGRTGVVFLACLVLALGGCADRGGPPEPAVLQLDSGSISLPAGVALVDIGVRAIGGGGGEFDPPAVQARVGDVVRFTTRDAQTHAIAFDPVTLGPAALEYLESHGQLRSPPLLREGASWVVSLADAPPGPYRFRCTTHGAEGTVAVSAPN